MKRWISWCKLRRLEQWWWQGMCRHARSACRDEVEALEQVRTRMGRPL